LHGALFHYRWGGDSIRRLLETPTARAFIAETGTAPVLAGFIIGQVVADEAEVLSLGVAPAWQRCGIAGPLMQEFAASAFRSGVKWVFLEVAADNAPALALYLREGFRCVGRRKCYYERRGAAFADALVLALTW
jgi:ribosomal-protein-alanine N-acetyltransferase